MIQDQFSDKSFRVFSRKLREFGPEARDLIKTASIDYDDVDQLPGSAFAWEERRKFPIHTPEHAALSIVYAHGESVPSYVSENLQKVAELYDIELPALEKQAEEIAENIDDYLIPHRKFGKITEKSHVKQACQFFSDNYKKMDLETRANAAATLTKKASFFDCRISPTFYKHAGLTKTNRKILGEWLEVRSNLTHEKHASISKSFTKLAEYVQDRKVFSTASRKDLIKLADTIAILDEKSGLIPKYDLTLPDPLLTVFNTTKVAEATVSLAGKNVEVNALMNVDPQTYGDILGADIVDEISQDGQLKQAELMDVLRTLPSDLQSLLVSSLGV